MALLLLGTMMLTSHLYVFASDTSSSDSKVKLIDELVIQMAERFAQTACTNVTLLADNPVKFYDESGKAIGYIVNYYNMNEPYGYIVFDTTGDSLISEYSFGSD